MPYRKPEYDEDGEVFSIAKSIFDEIVEETEREGFGVIVAPEYSDNSESCESDTDQRPPLNNYANL